MSHENPTPLRVGATGTLNGWRVRVASRLVMSVEVDGETYLWSEFNLVDSSGNSAMLVFEEGEDGPEWKLFREFTPTQPMTARTAAAKRVGDKVNLDGTPVAITLVDQSRVEFIEGEAPEGVEVGDVAHYFNADTGSRMLVASWTGEEIEFYEGLDAPAESVAAAFGFARTSSSSESAGAGTKAQATNSFRADAGSSSFQRGEAKKSSRLLPIIILAVLGGVSLFGAYSCFAGGRSAPLTSSPAAKRPAPPQRLALGASGTLADHRYAVVGQHVVEIARTSGRHDRREYLLREESAPPALLVNGLCGGAQEWHLLHEDPGPRGLMPYDAAAKRKGEPLEIAGRSLRVTDLFLGKIFATDTHANVNQSGAVGTVYYGFVGREAADVLVARWTESQIQFYRGRALPEAEVLAAFGPPATRAK